MNRRAPLYVDRILRGTKPTDLPSSNPPRSSWSLTSRLPRRSGLRCRCLSSFVPTSWSN